MSAQRQTLEQYLAAGGKITVLPARAPRSAVLESIPDTQPWRSSLAEARGTRPPRPPGTPVEAHRRPRMKRLVR